MGPVVQWVVFSSACVFLQLKKTFLLQAAAAHVHSVSLHPLGPEMGPAVQ